MSHAMETIIICRPDINVKEVFNKFQKLFSKYSYEKVHAEDIGEKSLAYDIQGHSVGHYFIFHYKVLRDTIDEIEKALKEDDDIMKFMSLPIADKDIDFMKKDDSSKSEQSCNVIIDAYDVILGLAKYK